MDPLPGSFLSMHPNTFLSQWCLRIKLLLTQMVVMVSLAHLEVTCTRIDVSHDSCNIHQRQDCIATSCFGTGDHCSKHKNESIVNDKDSGKIRIIAHDAKQCGQGAWVVQ